jgi:hypothetical protein
LKKAINLKKQKRLQEQRQLRTNKYNNEFKKIKPKIDGFLKGKKLNDSLWSMRYKYARNLTRSHFISYGGPPGDKLYELFVDYYKMFSKEE